MPRHYGFFAKRMTALLNRLRGWWRKRKSSRARRAAELSLTLLLVAIKFADLCRQLGLL